MLRYGFSVIGLERCSVSNSPEVCKSRGLEYNSRDNFELDRHGSEVCPLSTGIFVIIPASLAEVGLE